MQIKVGTQLSANWKTVKEGFNEKLFLSLNPPFPKVKLLRFDGSGKGDIVSLQLNFLIFKQEWTSEIIEDTETSDSFSFIDVGRKLPFFLSTWKHQHIIKGSGNSAQIIDNITYTTGSLLTDLIMYPLLLLQFLYRKPIYKKFFRKNFQESIQ